ncbi:hypothetical protein [Actinoplanes sp. ATCC 53533]|uniref:hypothetical protein n=1 Tax=Actinoplanes sp. ATCC 53533 TaxID=1288362 RepID=UPI000F7A2E54|nr:hypothetical protein [Actinoplanes sp. ATCC 53533]
MVEPGQAARGGAGAYRALKFGKRLFDQRGWFKYLRHRSLSYALMGEREELLDHKADLIAESFQEILDQTPIPMEPKRGFINTLKRNWRERGSQGVRFPEYRGNARSTFYEVLLSLDPPTQSVSIAVDHFCVG